MASVQAPFFSSPSPNRSISPHSSGPATLDLYPTTNGGFACFHCHNVTSVELGVSPDAHARNTSNRYEEVTAFLWLGCPCFDGPLAQQLR